MVAGLSKGSKCFQRYKAEVNTWRATTGQMDRFLENATATGSIKTTGVESSLRDAASKPQVWKAPCVTQHQNHRCGKLPA